MSLYKQKIIGITFEVVAAIKSGTETMLEFKVLQDEEHVTTVDDISIARKIVWALRMSYHMYFLKQGYDTCHRCGELSNELSRYKTKYQTSDESKGGSYDERLCPRCVMDIKQDRDLISIDEVAMEG